MESYVIQKNINSETFDCIIFSTYYVSPVENLIEIEEQLKGKRLTVLFDLLMSNGNSNNRYIVGEFNGTHFVYPSFRIITPEEKTIEIQKQSAEFYTKYSNYVEDSVLSQYQQNMIEKGIKLS